VDFRDDFTVSLPPCDEAYVRLKVTYSMTNIHSPTGLDRATVYALGQSDECFADCPSGEFTETILVEVGDTVIRSGMAKYCDWVGIPGFQWCEDVHDNVIITFDYGCSLVLENLAPIAGQPSGPTLVEIGHGVLPRGPTHVRADYTSTISDPNGDEMNYQITLAGSGTNYDADVTEDIIWSNPSTYSIRCTVTDIPQFPCCQQLLSDSSEWLDVVVRY